VALRVGGERGYQANLEHLFTTIWSVRRAFLHLRCKPLSARSARPRRRTKARFRFAVEHALDMQLLLSGRSARERALEVFSELRVWDTEHNNGVLIYLLLADRDVEIIADRGIHAQVGGGLGSDLPQYGEAASPRRIRDRRDRGACVPSESICSGTSRRNAAPATSFQINP